MSRVGVSKTFKTVTHAIFDMDGLLLGTESMYMEATQQILDEFGKTYTWDVKAQLMGMTEAEAAKRMVEVYKLPMGWEEYMERATRLYDVVMPRAALMPGVENLIKHLHEYNVACAVATSSSRQSFDVKTQCHKELFSLFRHIVTGGSDPEVKRGKPSPDIFMLTADRFAEKPKYEDCLVFEDAPNGVQGALAAGMQVVMVPDENTKAELCKDATLVLKSMADFQPELFGLPAFPNKCVC